MLGMSLPITINPNRITLDEAYLSMAEIWALRSKGNRLQVGALIVRGTRIISDGYNGMPTGSTDDVCEYWEGDTLRTKPAVLHAESNALMKLAKEGDVKGAEGATLYTTYSPCFECSKLILQARIKRVVFRNPYRDAGGITLLHEHGVEVVQLGNIASAAPVSTTTPKITVDRESRVTAAAPPQITQPSDEFARLRAMATAAPVPPPPPPAVAPSALGAGEDDVARLIRQAEAMMNQGAGAAKAAAAGVPAVKPGQVVPSAFGDIPVAAPEGPYRSTFS